ncbi:response regulator transcription factor [Sphingomonas sp. PR090111-T3T-6A]|uniref:response regulator transcription factor n=1 Tax=Sphingomonas sp. PR090111-T3T-6A TaxID=685778 RepID=UPI0022872468|nr:response regulator [Sphingomonas sp. PR090111-T3T-6A]
MDDNEAMRDALLNLLQVEGLSAEGYASAGAFLNDFSSRAFACLVTDVQMPGISGLELQCCLRTMGSDIPVIFVTSAEDAATMVQARAEGAAAYLTKPLATTEFVRALRVALGVPGRC